mgnify:CR=1 FL=1
MEKERENTHEQSSPHSMMMAIRTMQAELKSTSLKGRLDITLKMENHVIRLGIQIRSPLPFPLHPRT